MLALSSVPLEVLFLVTNYLSIDDIKSLRLVSKEFGQKAQPAYMDELFGRRTYFATIPDLQALLDFTKHPSKACLRLKHLRLDIASPYIHIRHSIFQDTCEEDLKDLKPPKLFHRVAFGVHYHNLEALEQSEDQALLFAALQNLPNLEAIEFVDRPGPPSEKALSRHYPFLMTRRYKDEFLAFYKDYTTRQRRGRLTSLLTHVMVALKNSPCRIKEILVDDSAQPYMLLSHSWFSLQRRHIKDLQVPLENLRVLELNLTQPTPDYSPDLGTYPDTNPANAKLQCLPEFFRNVLPNLETLKIRFEDVIDDFGLHQLTPNNLSFDPNLLIMKVELNLPHLRNLELRMVPFTEAELRTGLLLPHSSTLRRITMEDCVLQENIQMWSSIFELLEYELQLDSFRFCTKSVDRRIRIGKMPYQFEVRGDVQASNHICRVQISRKDRMTNTNLQNGLRLVRQFEEKIVHAFARALEQDTAGGIPDITINDSEDEQDEQMQHNHHHNHNNMWAYDIGDEDDFDDDDFGPPIPMMMPFLPNIANIGPPHLHIHPPPLASTLNTIQPYTSQPSPNAIPDLLLPAGPGIQPAPIDPTGHFLRINGGLNLPPGSVVLPSFIIPSTYLNTAALEGQPRTVQNILANLTPNALDIGVTSTAPNGDPSVPAPAAGSSAGPSTAPPPPQILGPQFTLADIISYINPG
ncbi:hypothetical protein TWF694_006388 [Orbilia ellipsospora]|uniref:F-box domain-containing protein n=1 Tax=Orbilia ellipsospora TaxID=2528407 RepID=A0AAV9XK22_9PEZI